MSILSENKIIMYRFTIALLLLFFILPAVASAMTGEEIYNRFSQVAATNESPSLFTEWNSASRQLKWDSAKEMELTGQLRIITPKGMDNPDTDQKIYLIRQLTGEVYILSIPDSQAHLSGDSSSIYAGLEEAAQGKMIFKLKVLEGHIDNEPHTFARFSAAPSKVVLDEILTISAVLMLFCIMIGMGMTLTLDDFALVFKKPRGMIVGEILQFGVMPFLGFALGHLLGFYENYPFIFIGLILITAIPGGVTSNLMTHYAKGDLALSISLTSISTVLSIVLTPLLLALYCTNMPEVAIPVDIVVQSILILVIIPLSVGMSVRWKWPNFAEKTASFFSALGMVALLVLIVGGTISNLHAFAETERYGIKFYSVIFALTFTGMLAGIVISKLVGVSNYQARAISLETGLRNSTLAMTIALLIQDQMGDFYSSMLFTSGLFGLTMFIAGILSIAIYKKVLPLSDDEYEASTSAAVEADA